MTTSILVNNMAERPEEVVERSRQMSDLLTRLQDNICKAEDKNDALLEAIETAEARSLDPSSSSETSLLRNLRARLAACHAPNASLKKDLPLLSGEFQERFKTLESTLKSYQELNIKLLQEVKDNDDQYKQLTKERQHFEEERESWNKSIEQARNEITEQNDRLTLLSRQLTGAKQELEVKSNDLASRRIAFEEEKLLQQHKEGEGASDGEIKGLRIRLREQALKNVELESVLLRTEVNLHQKEDELLTNEQKNKRLQIEVESLRTTSSKAVKQFEKRTLEANKQLAYMKSELTKAQDNAKRFQEILSIERRKQKALQHDLNDKMKQLGGGNITNDGLSPTAQKAYLDTLSETLQSVGKKPYTNMRTQDMIRKNEVILVENARLKADIHKLRIENADLLRRVRLADCNVHYMRNQVVTNLHDRAELMKRLDKAEQQHKELQYSLTRQATDWVHQKQSDKTYEKERQLNEIQPVSTLAASERTWLKGPSKVNSLSREIHVHRW